MNDRKLAEYTLEKLEKLGADAAAVSVSHSSTDELNVDGGEFSLMRTLFDTGVSLSVIKNGAKGTASINQTSKEDIDAACAAAIASAEHGKPDEAERIAPFEGKEKFTQGVLVPDVAALYDRIEEFLRDTREQFPKIIMEQFIADYRHESGIYMNTNGTEFELEEGCYGLSSMFSAHEGEAAGSFNGADAAFTSLDRAFMDMASHRRLFRESSDSLYPKPVDGKFEGTLIASPGLLASFMYTVLGNFCSNGTIIDGTSPWLSMLGRQVASKGFTLTSRPLDPAVVCGERFAGGFKSENMTYIEDGVLKGFMLSDYGARKTGFERAKNLSGSFFVEPGTTPLAEIIAGVERGIIVNRFSGGEPAQNGDFSGVAKNSFLVENGRIVGAVSETMINGSFLDLMKNVRAISSDTESSGGGVMPWAAFNGVTISGK